CPSGSSDMRPARQNTSSRCGVPSLRRSPSLTYTTIIIDVLFSQVAGLHLQAGRPGGRGVLAAPGSEALRERRRLLPSAAPDPAQPGGGNAAVAASQDQFNAFLDTHEEEGEFTVTGVTGIMAPPDMNNEPYGPILVVYLTCGAAKKGEQKWE
ncbi:unnamed protein product, partial [Prorocentrum cordatum]